MNASEISKILLPRSLRQAERQFAKMEKDLEQCGWVRQACSFWQDPFNPGHHLPTSVAHKIAMQRIEYGKTAAKLKKRPPQYGGDGWYDLMDGTQKINRMQLSRESARELNVGRKKHGHPLWWWSGKK